MGFPKTLYVAHFYGHRASGKAYDGYIIMRDAPIKGFMSLTNIDHPYKYVKTALLHADLMVHESIEFFGSVWLDSCGHLVRMP